MAHPFIPFENVAKVQMCFTQNGQKTQNVYHYWHTSGAIDASDLEDLAAGMKLWWGTSMKPLTDQSTSLRLILARDMTTAYSTAIEYSTGLPLQGTGSDSALPSNVSLTVKWGTGKAGRSFRGRTYHLGLSKDQVTGNEILPTPLSSLKTAYDLLVTTPTTNWQLVVASMMTNGTWHTTGIFNTVTSCTIEQYLDSQRRRLTGRGE